MFVGTICHSKNLSHSSNNTFFFIYEFSKCDHVPSVQVFDIVSSNYIPINDVLVSCFLHYALIYVYFLFYGHISLYRNLYSTILFSSLISLIILIKNNSFSQYAELVIFQMSAKYINLIFPLKYFYF